MAGLTIVHLSKTLWTAEALGLEMLTHSRLQSSVWIHTLILRLIPWYTGLLVSVNGLQSIVNTFLPFLYYLLVAWLKRLHSVEKHEKNTVMSSSSMWNPSGIYCDQVGRTLVDLTEDGVKVLPLNLVCFGKTSGLPVSPSVWLVFFLSKGSLFLCLVGLLCCSTVPLVIWPD